MAHLDGNVLAGPLSELFHADMTTASGRCAGCGDESALARAMVYESGHDFVVRCVECDTVLLTVVHTPGDVRLELRGVGFLRIPV